MESHGHSGRREPGQALAGHSGCRRTSRTTTEPTARPASGMTPLVAELARSLNGCVGAASESLAGCQSKSITSSTVNSRLVGVGGHTARDSGQTNPVVLNLKHH